MIGNDDILNAAVLIVDDQAENVLLLEQMLCAAGYRGVTSTRVRQEDTVARLGGDEFVIALWEPDHPDSATKLVSKVIDIVSQPCTIDGRTVCMTAGIGVAIYPTHGEDAEALLKGADKALYVAKHAGRNDYRIATRIDTPAVQAASRHIYS